MKSKNYSMSEGPILTNIISYTVPIILTNIFQLLFNAADLVIIGRYCGSVYVAAVGATSSLTTLLVNTFLGLSIGAGVVLAHNIGSENIEGIKRTVHTTFPAAVVCGIILSVIGVLFSSRFLGWMDTPSDIIPLSSLYMKIYFGGITFNIIYNFSASLLRAMGDTKGPLIILSISGIINVILNVFFIRVFEMNVAGVALATTISQGVCAVLIVLKFIRRSDIYKLELRKIHFYKDEILKIFKIGLPAGIQGSLFSISNVIIQSSVNSFGSVFMSGSAAAANIEGFVYASMNSFSHTSMNFIGVNTGAKNYTRVKKIFWTCMGCVTVVGLTLGLLTNLFGRQLLSVYITDSDLAISYGLIRLAFITGPYFLCGIMGVNTGTLRGLGESIVPMITSILGICGFRLMWIFTIFKLPQFHSPQWLFSSYAVSWIITGLIQFVVFLILFDSLKKTNQENLT